MDVSPYALVDLDSVKLVMGLTADSQDDLLALLINAASTMIESYCDRQFIARNYIDFLDGKGENSIILPQHPVNTIIEIADDPGFQWPTSTIIDPVAYTFYPDEGIVTLLPEYAIFGIEGIFYRGVRNVRVKYNAGYGYTDSTSPASVSGVPYDLQAIAHEIIIKKYKAWSTQSIGVQAGSVHGVNVSILLDDILPGHKLLLDRKYRKRSLGLGLY
jgi:hypothetical protein